jgi:signal transduction histidine kinase
LRDTALEALREMRLLIFELRPSALSDRGLVAALESRLSAVEGRAGLVTGFEHGEVGELPEGFPECLYGIAREALNNVLKHANARRVTVRLLRSEGLLRLEIEDDGLGFDVAEGRLRGGLGLAGIEERSRKLKAHCDVSSRPGRGTRIRVEVPLP